MIGEITPEMIDAGARALRERQQGHKRLNDWPLVPNAQKKPWREHAEAVIRAALEEAAKI
jgi:hypothetical protein